MRAISLGGPPDGHWERNGVEITKYNYDDITIQFELNTSSPNVYYEVPYVSMLVVQGTYPGMYIYSVSNKITNKVFSGSMLIEGTYCVCA